jgi:hypothetical protein
MSDADLETLTTEELIALIDEATKIQARTIEALRAARLAVEGE